MSKEKVLMEHSFDCPLSLQLHQEHHHQQVSQKLMLCSQPEEKEENKKVNFLLPWIWP
jgi:hypothetical protein